MTGRLVVETPMPALSQRRIRVIAPLGTGGMATVHLGIMEGLGGFTKLVAVKRPHPHLAEDAKFNSMLLDEARLAATMRHVNVVPVLDVFEEDGAPVLVLELIEGVSLSTLLKDARAKGGVFPLDVAVRIVLDMLSGLHAAHEAKDTRGRKLGIVHRDVSPHNVLVGEDGVSRVSDFGVAKARARLVETRSGEVRGKLAYMAPEQMLGGAVDARTDLFGVGAVLWELLTLERLFEADAMTPAGRTGPPLPALAELRAELPAGIDAVVRRALADRPEARFGTALEMTDALEAAAHGASSRGVARFVAEVSGERIQRFRELTWEAERRRAPFADNEIEALERRADAPTASTSLFTAQTLPTERDPPAPRGPAVVFGVVGALLAILLGGGLLWVRPWSTSTSLGGAARPGLGAATESSPAAPAPPTATPAPPPSAAPAGDPAPSPPSASSDDAGSVPVTHGAAKATKKPLRHGRKVKRPPRRTKGDAKCETPYRIEKDGTKRFLPECL